MTPSRRPTALRWRNRALTVLVTAGLVSLNAGPWSPIGAAVGGAVHDYRTSRPDYMAEFGRWRTIEVPDDVRVNALHAALLPTGKVLIIAGSGNVREDFEAGTFATLLWDPATDEFRRIATPDDMFCAGHAFLPDGKLLVAGGTAAYEVLAEDVTRAAGPMTITNESPDGGPVALPAGTRFTAPGGAVFTSTADVEVAAAQKMTNASGTTMVHPSSVEVWVEAVEEGEGSVVDSFTQYRVDDRTGSTLYGTAERLTLDKQDYRGARFSYEFDPWAEQYVRVGDLNEARWYPTLVGMGNGDVLASSGLDEFGRVLQGQTEVYSPATRQWTYRPDLTRYFPTYPALFLLADGRLFYTGSNAGYGPDDEGRTPGVWDLRTNRFDTVPGLRDPDMTETSASVLLPPAQDQRFMVLGGGGIGESAESTPRTDVVDLTEPVPRFRPAASLSEPTRYLSTVVLPDDTVLTTGGSRDYRGRGDSDVRTAQVYHPDTDTFTPAAAPEVGRNYHSEALLLPDGRVVTFGSDPLYGDAEGEQPGTFEQRIEVYEPAYLHRGPRPVLTGGPEEVPRGAPAVFDTPDAGRIATARLLRPSAVTHATDVEQRSIALQVTPRDGAVEVVVPDEAGLVPPGWYMLVVVDEAGVPSGARWVRVP